MRSPYRRDIVKGAAAVAGFGAMAAGAPPATMTDEMWQGWLADWRRMEVLARRRDWEADPVRVLPPATEAAIARIELHHGLVFPTQLRAVMTGYARAVLFGWNVPAHLRPLERVSLPTMSAMRGFIWELSHIDRYAIPNFFGWKRELADRDISEAPNRPEMWEHQFPIAELINGDMLTIDISNRNGPQPVRYFSHELEGLHHTAVAPDFLTFVTVLSALGWAGPEQDSWFGFLSPADDDKRYLSTTTAGARSWFDWLQRDPASVGPDEPPVTVVARTPADYALLAAAYANSIPGVATALDGGATIDVVPVKDWLLDNQRWDLEFATAVTFATRADNTAMLALLLHRGATLNTRRLPLGDAMLRGSLDTVKWLIAHGARVNGWKDDRHWPLHALITRRGRATPEGVAEARKSLTDVGISEREADEIVDRPIDRTTYLELLAAVLDAGADPDAAWDNGVTMLMWSDLETAERLLAHGADVRRRDAQGQTVMHWVQSVEKARLLIAHGADINALSSPRGDDAQFRPVTPLQWQLLGGRLGDPTLVAALIELGADPRIRDGDGRGALAYCSTIANLRLIAAFGLDPLERLPDGGTLLHNLARLSARPMKDLRDLFDHLLGLGIDINAVDRDGQTLLHRLAPMELTQPEDIEIVLSRGADATLRDKNGRRAFDLAPASHVEVRALLDRQR